ncbi:MAG: hypothetical protein CMC38_06565 [Flavobacteriaceae bacterium]|nr:hypothetical protein [Flavobacteriaceae bacterium]|tara:strand:- start:5150 stop:6010 length:861 start_codon:yes stop_codon:yes gene_type:complete
MFDLLFAKTFLLVGGMLIITTIFSRINKAYETVEEAIINIAGSFIILFLIIFLSDSFPTNIILVAVFSAFIGWSIGPTISTLGYRFKSMKYFRRKGIRSKTVITKKSSLWNKFWGAEDEKKTMYYKKSSPNELFDINSDKYKSISKDFESSYKLKKDTYDQEWQNLVFQAMLGTTIAILSTSFLVFNSTFDFSILGGYLFIALTILIIMGFLNIFIFKSRFLSLIKSYIGVIIFTGYLLYDFNLLEQRMNIGDDSWSSAVKIAVNIYLDIINLFLDLLQILAESNN